MTNLVDITRRLQARRQFDYVSGQHAILVARTRADELLAATEGQLVVPVDDIFAAICELRAIIRADATWPDDATSRDEVTS